MKNKQTNKKNANEENYEKRISFLRTKLMELQNKELQLLEPYIAN